MPGRAVRITSRILFLICGLTTLLTAAPYAMLRGADLPVESEWILFVIALAFAGASAVVTALSPLSWVARVCKRNREDARLLSGPLTLLGVFAGISYLVAVVAYLAPHTWNLNPQLMLILCPMYLLKMTFDPSPLAVFLLLAPMNAAVYGSLGVTLALAVTFLRRSE